MPLFYYSVLTLLYNKLTLFMLFHSKQLNRQYLYNKGNPMSHDNVGLPTVYVLI